MEVQINSIIKKNDVVYLVTDVDNSFRKYKRYATHKDHPCAIGTSSKEISVDITKGTTGYAKPVNTDESPKRMSFAGCTILSVPDFKELEKKIANKEI
jgi:hypothetical protein